VWQDTEGDGRDGSKGGQGGKRDKFFSKKKRIFGCYNINILFACKFIMA